MKEAGELPETLTAISGGGGRHYFFKHPGVGSVPSNNGLRPGLDRKADGGYIILPHSKHKSGRLYEWQGTFDPQRLAQCPAWLVTLHPPKNEKLPSKPGPVVVASSNKQPSNGKLLPWLIKKATIDASGRRNEAGLWLACQFRDNGIEFEVAREAMLDYCEMVNQRWPGDHEYSPSESLDSLQQAYSREPRQPFKNSQTEIQGPDDITDVKNAARFAEANFDSLRYCHPFKKWIHWTGKVWSEDETGETIRRAKGSMRGNHDQAGLIADDELRKKTRRRAVDFDSHHRISAMLSLSQSEIPILPEEFDRFPMLLNVANGILNLETGELIDHDKGLFLTKYSPASFDPIASAPIFQKFLSEIQPDPGMRSFLQRYFGYCATGLTTEQDFAIFCGTGDNGKSVLIEIMSHVLGEYAVFLPRESILMKRQEEPIRNDLAMLKGARIAICMESGVDRRLDETLVKSLTGQDTITVRRIYESPFTFKPECKIILGTNHKPQIRSNSYAIWKRE